METKSSSGWTWGQPGQAQIFKHSDLRHKIEDSSIGFPESEFLVADGPKLNFFILGDNAFPFKFWLMKPYTRLGTNLEQRLFNYRISRGRRVVENTFGILMSYFTIFQWLMQQEPLVVARVVVACLVLHNLLMIRYATGQQDGFGGEGQSPIVLEVKDFPHEGRNPLEAAKTQEYSQGLFHE